MTEIGATGFALIAALAAGLGAYIFVRARFQRETDRLTGEIQRVSVEGKAAQADLVRERELRASEKQEWISERDQLLSNFNLASDGRSRAEASLDAAQTQLKNLGDERQGALDELAKERERARSQEIEATSEKARADEADRSRQAALEEKQVACDQLIEAERRAHEAAMTTVTTSHEESIKRLNEHLNMREREHEKAIAAMQEAGANAQRLIKDASEKELESKQQLLDELKEYIKTADEVLKATFGDASRKALQSATESFFDIAKKRFDERDEAAKVASEAHRKGLEQLLEPVKEELGELEKLNREIEKERAEAFGSLRETIQNLNKSNESLANALKRPSVRGSWGEGQLLSILESSGWVQGKNFDVQDVTEDDGKTQRTDVVIHLPRGRKIIIDSKVPLDHYMAAMEMETEEDRLRKCQDHAKAVRGHVKALEKKEYWLRYAESPPYVILFLPYEAAYQIACEHDRALLDDAHRARIILSNPMTLMNLVHLATFVLNEERLQENAEEVRTHAKQLCERLGKVLELMADHGRHVRIAAESYNKMVASVGSRLIPSATRMRELGAGAEKALAVPDTVDSAIRHLIVPERPELPEQSALALASSVEDQPVEPN